MDITLFEERFKTEDQCLAWLAGQKWKDGFKCRKCGHTNYCKGRTPHSRRCTRCKYEETAKSFTVFHRCRVPLPTAFKILFQVCNDETISSYQLSKYHQLRQMTCWRLKRAILDCINDHNANKQK